MTHLDGKVALVTGGARGLGRGIARELSAHGAHVVVCDTFREPDGTLATDTVAREIRAAGGTATGASGDVSTFGGAQAIVDDVVADQGRIDIVVNCAGNFADSSILTIEEQEWDSIAAVHLTGHAGIMTAAAARMIAQGGGGRIITVASRGAFYTPGVAYATAKAGVMGLTANAAGDLAEAGITVNCILPSATTQLFPSDGSLRTPGRMPASLDMAPEAIAPVVAYLCAPEAAGITGRFFYLSGGDLAIYTTPLELQHANLFIRTLGHWTFDDVRNVVQPLLGVPGAAGPTATGVNR